jgi:hypothetical protein
MGREHRKGYLQVSVFDECESDSNACLPYEAKSVLWVAIAATVTHGGARSEDALRVFAFRSTYALMKPIQIGRIRLGRVSTLMLGVGSGLCIAISLVNYGFNRGYIVLLGLCLAVLAPIFRSIETPDEQAKPHTRHHDPNG